MRGFFFMAHSGVRYLVLLAAIVAIGYLLMAVMQRRSFGKTSRTLSAIYTGLLDLQTLLGLLTMMMVPFYPQLLGHIFSMFAAVFAAHGFVMTNKRKPESEQTNLAPLLGVVVSAGLIILGVMAIGRPIFGSS
jgi:heme A synthase